MKGNLIRRFGIEGFPIDRFRCRNPHGHGGPRVIEEITCVNVVEDYEPMLRFSVFWTRIYSSGAGAHPLPVDQQITLSLLVRTRIRFSPEDLRLSIVFQEVERFDIWKDFFQYAQ